MIGKIMSADYTLGVQLSIWHTSTQVTLSRKISPIYKLSNCVKEVTVNLAKITSLEFKGSYLNTTASILLPNFVRHNLATADT